MNQIIEECKLKKFDIIVSTETRSETYTSEMKEWKIMNFLHNSNEKPNGGAAFVMKKNLKVSSDSIPNKCATLQL